ncbi:uncharacterized protein LOC144716454 [Wolffia australiana]
MESFFPAAETIRGRLAMQKEILRKLEEVAQRLESRAKEVTKEVRDLEDLAGAAERDLMGAVGALGRLNESQSVENIIREEINFRTWDSSKTSASGNIPAQNFEIDILPRYKDALTSGLASFHDHHRNAEKKYTGKSIFNPWAVRGPLPHIIGSEEFIHDSTCGLVVEDSAFKLSLDPSDMAESKEFSPPDADPTDIFSTTLFGMEKMDLSNHDKTEPLVSAASDFKVMLEAALRSPYKFYDEEGSSHATETDNSAWAAHPDLSTLISGGQFDSEDTTVMKEADADGPTFSNDDQLGIERREDL